jgi:catechol 2,3-dioxygenase-like lactoylglutathione lyase family enzyme
MNQIRNACYLALTVVLTAGSLAHCRAAEPAKNEFARATIDLGMVVTDVARSAKFYSEAIGFQEVAPFTVSAEFCADAGLTDRKELSIRVFTLGNEPSATKLKLMTVPGVQTRKSDNDFVHSQTGYRYLTIYVADGAAALERLRKAGVKPLGKAPVAIPGNTESLSLAVVRDPDGNLVELIGRYGKPKP